MSVQDLLATYDCAVPGCPDEARERGGVCRYHEGVSRLSVCKVDGCTNQTAGKGGPWKNYCQQHMSEEIARRQAVRHAKPAALPVPPPQREAKKPEPRAERPAPRQHRARSTASRETSASAAPSTLVQLAQHVEDTKAAVAQSQAAHTAAVQQLREALDAA
jgi:hypothetical protein